MIDRIDKIDMTGRQLQSIVFTLRLPLSGRGALDNACPARKLALRPSAGAVEKICVHLPATVRKVV